MPDQRAHRGPHPEDHRLFDAAALGALQTATSDLAWLLGRGYAIDAALKLVGDRFGLDKRQRLSVARATCNDDARVARQSRELDMHELAGRELIIDGYNLLTTIEAALAGGVILLGRDGTYRDMASMHGTYRKVEETLPAIELIGRALRSLRIKSAHWLLDSPVSNSGRLAGILRETAEVNDWPWTVELANNPDALLIAAAPHKIVVSADSVLLDRGGAWCNLARHIVDEHVPDAWIVDLSTIDFLQEPSEESASDHTQGADAPRSPRARTESLRNFASS